jgi:ERCC4-type nuclease
MLRMIFCNHCQRNQPHEICHELDPIKLSKVSYFVCEECQSITLEMPGHFEINEVLDTNISNNDFTIIVDTREKPDFYSLCVLQVTTDSKMERFKIKRDTLLAGDLKFRSLGAERKRIDDFVASIIDNRIFSQIYNMSRNYTMIYVLVVGNPDTIEEKYIRAVYTTIADIEARYGARVLFFPTDEMLIHYFSKLCMKYSKNLRPIYIFTKKSPTIADEQVNMLCGIYRVGYKTAKKLLLKYGSIQNIATQETLGKGKIYSHIHDVIIRNYDDTGDDDEQ